MKYRSFLLAFILLFSTVASSCGEASQAPETTRADSTVTTPGQTETTGAYKKPDVDYKGAEFTFLDYDTTEYFWQAATYSDIRADEETGEPINDAQYKRNVQVEEELNITLNTHPVSGVARTTAAELRKYILSGEDYIDAAFIFGNDVKSVLTEEKMLIDLNAIGTLDISAPWWDKNAVDSLTIGGSLKVITGDISLYTTFSPILYYFNKEVAADFGIDGLYDLVREGKWTHDKLLEYCELVSSDVNGDNIMDENDRYGIALQAGLLPDMLIAEGSRFSKKNSTGDLEITLNSEHTVSVVENCVKFLNDPKTAIIATNYQTKYANPYFEMHLPMFKNNQILFNYNQILISFELRSMNADYGLLPTPKFDEKQENYYTSLSSSWMTFLCVPATNSDLDMTGHVLDAMGYYSQKYVTPEFIDTTVRTKSLRDDDSAEMLDIVLANKVYDIAFIYDMGGIWKMVFTLGMKNNLNFASEYAAIESTVKTELEKFQKNIK